MGAPLRFTVYYGERRFLLLASRLVMEPRTPYRRIAPTLLLACKEPFWLECGEDITLSTRAALIAPNTWRRRLVAVDSDLAVFELPLHSIRATKPAQSLDIESFLSLMPALERALGGSLPCAGLDALFEAAVRAIAGQVPALRGGTSGALPAIDPRIERALKLLDELPFDEARLTGLANQLALSPSRFRHLFKEVTGDTVGHYARWAAVWRAVSLWSQGQALSDIVRQVGFPDLAHLDHAFNELFGVNPASVLSPENVTLIHCP
ncbi:helix-turn-helix domain-containing protein [Pendulispora albinea]|uniref:AraC family transcriptional regulator n=1 Tax=Pendulispora albinea TaxID=2741071 RepID=A0ABZ2LNY4_9BACT